MTRRDLQNFILQVFDEIAQNYLEADLEPLTKEVVEHVLRSQSWPMTMSLEARVHNKGSFEDLQIVRFVHEEDEVASIVALIVHFPLPEPAFVVFTVGPGSFQFALRLQCPPT